jgi:hypothetical protein
MDKEEFKNKKIEDLKYDLSYYEEKVKKVKWELELLGVKA